MLLFFARQVIYDEDQLAQFSRSALSNRMQPRATVKPFWKSMMMTEGLGLALPSVASRERRSCQIVLTTIHLSIDFKLSVVRTFGTRFRGFPVRPSLERTY